MISEGRIVIDLTGDGGVRLTSSRHAEIGKLFEGRQPAEVMQLLPMVFALCARAHVAAARRALLPEADAAERRADALAVLAENAREHLLRILIGWRGAADHPPASAAQAMSLVAEMTAASDAVSERAVAEGLARLLSDHVLGIAPDRFLEIRSLAMFHDWTAQGQALAPRHLARVIDRGWQGLGAVAAHWLPEMPGDELLSRMTEPDFTASPDWCGRPCETGPLARARDHPLVAAVIERHGAGLLARLVARLVELAGIPGEIGAPRTVTSGTPGLGVVETARGRLIHAAQVKDGIVAKYRILAPTEWNFHPQGAAFQSLRQLTPGSDLVQEARALVEAIDPCVDFEVRAA